ncbi:MAG: WXG100 family type VII secretion target [Corynebacterium sp.]|nr:WXG100 family type VII secretion target [Corynebacterium sp.]
MDNNTIKYSFGAIQEAAADIRSTSARINTVLEDLKRQLEPMVATWEGDSAEAYQEAQQKWDTAAAELNTILDTIGNTVDEGNGRMSDVNRRAASTWR